MHRAHTLLALLTGALLWGCTSLHPHMSDTQPTAPINENCPRSGKPVVEDSLTEYRGYTVGFCNTHCRDDFAADPKASPSDRKAFDAIIAKLEN